jgi:hypothetical protein
MNRFSTLGGAVGCAALISLFSNTASAAENVSADVGLSYNSHFVSYGADVWGGGSDFFGDRSTTSIYGDLAIKFDALTFTLTVWSDLNDNTVSNIGGHIQEIDVDPGFTYTMGKVTAGVTYNAWTYAGDVEESLDFSLGFDDTGLIAPGFALNPKVTWHDRVSGNLGIGQRVGSAIVLSVAPSIPLDDGFSLTIPAGVAFFTTKDFQGGTKDGYGFSYVGGSLGYGLGFIPASYGKWSVNFDLIAYFTDSKAIPSNPEHNFLTGSVGLKVAY